jgi:hypothetical protein
MITQLDAEGMRDLGRKIAREIPGLGFALITFEFHRDECISNYISNANREDMIKGLRETIQRLEKNQIFKTPEAGEN